MAHFLRDQQITNLTTTEENLAQLSSTFLERAAMINANVTDDARLDKDAFVTYVTRFDNIGYRVFSLDDLLRYFAEAKTVKRELFTLETGENPTRRKIPNKVVKSYATCNAFIDRGCMDIFTNSSNFTSQ